jgi:hypothetical protein
MNKLQIKNAEGKWEWVFCRDARGASVITTEHKAAALPPKACWAASDLHYFRRWFAYREFRLAATLEQEDKT